MFKLHERTRRRICRGLFCLLCLLPTAGVIGWSTAFHLDSYARRCEEQLADRLGMGVRLAGVSHPRPGVFLYEGAELADRESGARILQCGLLEARRDGKGLDLRAWGVVIEAAQMHRLGQCLEQALGRERLSSAVRLQADRVMLVSRSGSRTAADIVAAIKPRQAGDQAELSFRLAGRKNGLPATLELTRVGLPEKPATRFRLHTGGDAIPSWLLVPLGDVASVLGPGSRFSGQAWGERTAAGWSGEFTGRLDGIELETLVSSRFAHELSGLADAEIERARFEAGRLVEAKGILRAGPGVVGRSLLASAATYLDVRLAAQFPRGLRIDYDELGLAFELRPDGTLDLAGACAKASAPGTLLVDGQGRPLAGEPRELQTVLGLVRALVPESEFHVPATRQTESFIAWLPLPGIVAARRSETRVTTEFRPPRAAPR